MLIFVSLNVADIDHEAADVYDIPLIVPEGQTAIIAQAMRVVTSVDGEYLKMHIFFRFVLSSSFIPLPFFFLQN